MAKSNSYAKAFTNIANAIRFKNDSFGLIPVDDMPAEIKKSSSGMISSYGAVTNEQVSCNVMTGIYTSIAHMNCELISQNET